MINLNLSTSTRDHSHGFLQRMVDRMDAKHSKYGSPKPNYSGRYSFQFLDDLCETLYGFLCRWENKRSTTAGGNAILFTLKRLYLYANGSKDKNLLPGTADVLVDAANGLMIEYLSPQVPGAVKYSKVEDSNSLGFVGMYQNELNPKDNDE